MVESVGKLNDLVHLLKVLPSIREGVIAAPREKYVPLLMVIGQILNIVDKFYALFLGIESRQSCVWLEKVIAAVVIPLVILESTRPAVPVLKGTDQDLLLMTEIPHAGPPEEIEALVLIPLLHIVVA